MQSVNPHRKNQRLTRWTLYLAQFSNMKVIHRPGRVHRNADALSRLQQKRNKTNQDDQGRDRDTIPTTFMVNVISMGPQLRKILTSALPDDRHLERIYKNLRDMADQMRERAEPGNPTRMDSNSTPRQGCYI
jgi:hypothetical protein